MIKILNCALKKREQIGEVKKTKNQEKSFFFIGKKIIALLVFIYATIFLSGCGKKEPAPTPKPELMIFASEACKRPMDNLALEYTKKTGVKLNFIYGGSGEILSNLQTSGAGDIFIPSANDYIEIAKSKNLLSGDGAFTISYLIPVVLVAKKNPKKIKALEDLAKKRVRVGIATPETVSIGMLSIEILDKNKLLKPVMKNTKIWPEQSVKVLSAVVNGIVDAVICWDFYGKWNSAEVTVIPIEKRKLPRISCLSATLLKSSKHVKESNEFIKYLISEEGKNYFRKFGYSVDEKDAGNYAELKLGSEYKLPDAYYKLINN